MFITFDKSLKLPFMYSLNFVFPRPKVEVHVSWREYRVFKRLSKKQFESNFFFSFSDCSHSISLHVLKNTLHTNFENCFLDETADCY